MNESDLRTLLDNLDMSRASLHGWLHFCTFLVVFGVALEVAFVVWEYAEELHDFRRGIVHPPEKPGTLLLLLGLLGAGLVAVGVAGELYIDVQAGKVETEIRKVNELRVSLLSKEAGDANTSAKGAADASGKAQGKADSVAKQADELLRKYIAAKRDLLALRAKTAPRRLSSEQKELLRRRLAKFSTKTIFVSCENGGREAFDFEQDFVDALSGYLKTDYLSGCDTVMGGGSELIPPIGIVAGAERQADSDTLFNALVGIGVDMKDIETKKTSANKSLLILSIGPKPP